MASSITRLLTLPNRQHILLLGARGTGKSTLLAQQFDRKKTLWIDLLNPEEESRFIQHPMLLAEWVNALPNSTQYVIIDEVQKVPKLLDVVHHLITTTDKFFILTGSSARKLRRGSANLLAGRALYYQLFPFSFLELKQAFSLEKALSHGLLPQAQLSQSSITIEDFLRSYTYTYLKEEIAAEQLVRKLESFRSFLEVAAQMHGKIINYNNIARDVGIQNKTVQEYFSILEDTLLGFYLLPFQHSFRERLGKHAKFFFIDGGIVRALSRTLTQPITPKTSHFGEWFEQFIVIECWKLAHYHYPDYRLSFLYTKDGAEIDLVVERPGKKLLLIEIKSSDHVAPDQLRNLRQIGEALQAERVCFSQEQRAREVNGIRILPWKEGIKAYFALNAK